MLQNIRSTSADCLSRTGRLGLGKCGKGPTRNPPSCSNLPTESFPFSEKVFMLAPPPRHVEVASLIFRPGYGQYGVRPGVESSKATNLGHIHLCQSAAGNFCCVTYLPDCRETRVQQVECNEASPATRPHTWARCVRRLQASFW